METTTGCRLLDLHDPVQSTATPLAVLYPAVAPERTVRFGPYALDVAPDAPPVGAAHPLVVLSHGNGGTPWAYRDLAKHLARAGFVVALPEHPGNSRGDNRLAGTAANLANRPRHLSLTVDAVLADPILEPHLQPHLAPTAVAVIGHSIGAYTALALAGGKPWAAPHETPDHQPHPVPVTPDPRVCALVLLTPAAFWFPADSLRDVRVPLLLRSGEKDTITPPAHAEAIQHAVADPSLVEHTVLPGAGHFSVMSPFPPEMVRPDFPPSQDPAGCDRLALEPTLFADIAAFLHRTLTPA